MKGILCCNFPGRKWSGQVISNIEKKSRSQGEYISEDIEQPGKNFHKTSRE